MATLSFFVGVIGITSFILHKHAYGFSGNIISVLLFLSPLGTFCRIVKHRTTEEFESFPYICTLLNSALWTYYGVTKPGSLLVATINSFGVVVEIVFVSLFLVFAPPRMRAKTATLVAVLDVGFLAGVILISSFLLHGDTKIDVIGFLAAGLNIVMYASPLAAMKTVVSTKSVEYMPFFLSLFTFLNGGIWTFYAVLLKDVFLGVPNGAGFILGTAQLVLYAIYRNAKSSSKKMYEDLKDHESQHEHLLPSSSTTVQQNIS